MPDLNLGTVTLGQPFWDAAFGFGIVLLAASLAWVAHFLLNRIATTLNRRWRNHLGERLVRAVSRPLMLLIFFQGLYFGVNQAIATDLWSSEIRSVWVALVITLIAVIIVRLVSGLLIWYGRYGVARPTSPIDRRFVPPLRRMATLGIYVLAGMLILDQFGVSISPLIAGFGIGGLAVALALQPTLSNFFAGTYLASGNVLSPGDYIELETGLRGYVVEVGWRSTRLRTSFNNLVIIPNSRLADSILTNFYGPTMEMGVIVEAGVSYDSDLAEVERVAMAAAREVTAELDVVVKDEPWFGYERFGESNIDFWLWLTATDRIGSFTIKTELIKRLHLRFREAGIEINYPVRKLVFAAGNGAAPFVATAYGEAVAGGNEPSRPDEPSR